ncbi:DUF2269 domain-containing protein [Cryptosporangium phraense]|uniref:DUF2269 domain-containing protein n=1 Tax=Cryptosporangium phraense TaxID=2593070 RepID=A0A545AWM8_9ACTN|nr:DUF2269 domain-containing protein [Cryptosporangium phraense]TQS45732.1 DUF2269 domain-containing protein [Cryptosporangium phraense]
MKLSPRWRKVALVVHVTTSVGWLGADAVLLVLGIAGLTGAAGGPAGVYPVAGLIGTVLIAPLTVAALVTGVVSSVGTKWGLLRYWWVAVKLGVTVLMNGLVLFLLTPGLREAARLGGDLEFRDALSLVIAPSVACVLLLFMTVLSVVKPWGRTARGRAVRPVRRVPSAA